MENMNQNNIEEVALEEVMPKSRFSPKKIAIAGGIMLGAAVLAVVKSISSRRVIEAEAEACDYEDLTEDECEVDIDSDVE